MDKFVELQRSIAEKKQAYKGFLEGITGRSMTDEEDAQATAYEKDIESMERQAARMKKLTDNMTEPPAPAGGSRGLDSEEPQAPNVILGREKDLEPGIRFARAVKVSVVANTEGKSLEEVGQRMYKGDKMFERGAMQNIGVQEDGGYLVPDNTMQEILPLLREQSSIRKLGASQIPLPNGKIRIPRQTGAANFYWTGESKPIIVSNAKLGMMALNAKKLAGLIPLTNEFLKSSSMDADRFVRDELINGIAEAEDVSAIYGKGTENEPKGLANLITQKSDVGALIDDDAMGRTIGTIMASKLADKRNFGWLFNGVLWSHFYNMKDANGNYTHRGEMNQGMLHGFNFEINNNINVGTDEHGLTEIYFGSWSNFMIGQQQGLQIDVSTQASYKDGDDQISAFQNDMTLMRAIQMEDFNVRRAEAFVALNKVWSK